MGSRNKAATIIESSVYQKIALGLLILGGILQLWANVQGRDFFLDEQSLLLNIGERSLAELWTPLSYDQHAPPLYLSLLELLSYPLGIQELSMRLPSLVSAWIALGLAYVLGRRYLSHMGLLYFCAMMAGSYYMLRYGSEAKQYMIDVAVGLAICYLRPRPRTLAALAPVFVWLSMPSVFFIAGAGLSYLSEKPLRKYFWWLAIGSGLSFGMYYFTLLAPSVGSEHLSSYHQSYFLSSDVSQSLGLLLASLDRAIGKTSVILVLGLLAGILGLYHLLRKDRATLLLFVVPILAALAASAVGKYSLIPRLILCLFPMVWLVIGIGMDWVIGQVRAGRLRVAVSGLTMLFAVLSVVGSSPLERKGWPITLEEPRKVLEGVAAWGGEDVVLTTFFGEHATKLYGQHHARKLDLGNVLYVQGSWPRVADSLRAAGVERVVLFNSHTFGQEWEAIAAQWASIAGEEVGHLEAKAARAKRVALR